MNSMELSHIIIAVMFILIAIVIYSSVALIEHKLRQQNEKIKIIGSFGDAVNGELKKLTNQVASLGKAPIPADLREHRPVDLQTSFLDVDEEPESDTEDDEDDEDDLLVRSIIRGQSSGNRLNIIIEGNESDDEDSNRATVEVIDDIKVPGESGSVNTKPLPPGQPADVDTNLASEVASGEDEPPTPARRVVCGGTSKKTGASCKRKPLKGKMYCKEHEEKIAQVRLDDVQLSFTDGSKSDPIRMNGGTVNNPIMPADVFNSRKAPVVDSNDVV